MTALSGTPRAFKGAVVGLDPFNPLASVIVFQYNPEKLTSCGGFDAADSWAHFVNCLSGQPADQPPTIQGLPGGGGTP